MLAYVLISLNCMPKAPQPGHGLLLAAVLRRLAMSPIVRQHSMNALQISTMFCLGVKTPVLLLLQISEYNAAQGVLNWVAEPAAGTAPPRVELRLYDVLFSGEDPAGAEDWLADLNPKSLEVVCDALASPPLIAAQPGDRCETLGILPFYC